MTRRTIAITLAQAILVIGASVGLGSVLGTGPIQPRLECESIYGTDCSPLVETRVGYQRGQITPTPCGWWVEREHVPFEPIPSCALEGMDATTTVGIADGSIYVIHQQDEGTDGTPTVWIEGTLPPHARPVFTRRALGISDYPDAGEDQE